MVNRLGDLVLKASPVALASALLLLSRERLATASAGDMVLLVDDVLVSRSMKWLTHVRLTIFYLLLSCFIFQNVWMDSRQ